MFLKTTASALIVMGSLYAQAAAAAPLTSADANGDGAISRDEALDAQNDSFKRLDDDGDNQLSRDEFDAGQPGVPEDASDEDVARRKQVVGRWFDQIDANSDGAISASEYQKAVSPYFDRLDANHDGKISKQELQESFQEVDEAQAELGG